MAIEDIGLADPQALVIATPPRAYDFWARRKANSPSQAVIYMATAPKSNAG